MNSLSLVLQSGYTHITLALFIDGKKLDQIIEENKKASRNIILHIDTLLKQNGYSLSDCVYLAALQGPGPFTTLRVVIATINGLSFARQLPLIGIDGLDALMREQRSDHHDYTIALLNAFTDDVYFGIYQRNIGIIAKGCMNIVAFIQTNTKIFAGSTLLIVGNGATLHQTTLYEAFGNLLTIPAHNPEQCSIDMVGSMAHQKWLSKSDITQQLLPLYLKASSAIMGK